MIGFLLKGIIRDRSRSLFPFLTVSLGVMLTVFLYCYINGLETNFIDSTARYASGHVKIMTRSYAAEADQIPNDLAYIGVNSLLEELSHQYPELIWTPRIRFAGLLDVPDEVGETKIQGPISGIALDLFNPESPEYSIFDLKRALVAGRLPEKMGEALLSADLAQTMDLKPGDKVTLISSTMDGSLAVANFTITGFIRFGITALDRGAMIADLRDIQQALDMEDAAGEILGFYKNFVYRDKEATLLAQNFNDRYKDDKDEFAPLMLTLKKQSGLAELLGMMNLFSSVLVLIFVVAMAIVLWNAGLMGSLRRYGEIGVRLAMGEDKGHLYRSLLIESAIIGFLGSLAGTALGLAVSYYLQAHGIDISSLMKSSSLLVVEVLRTKVTAFSYFIGFIPGVGASLLGTAISGLGVYRRQTSVLMKELEG
ncbi:MAG: FtsX-like permease family protein [Candidatus Aminicenantes bacterium]|nr:FtsX-like permease family protein [Candidatus Aminicenantes bacterium]